MRTFRRRFFVFSLLVLAILTITGCQAKTPTATEAQVQAETPIQAEDNTGLITAEGKLVPKENVNLSFATGGQVKEVLVKEGEKVSAGQVLATLDTTEAQLNVQQAEADLAAAQINYDQAPIAEPARRQSNITAATLSLAEALAGMTFVQLVRPGTPVILFPPSSLGDGQRVQALAGQ